MDNYFFEDLHQQFENTRAILKEKGVLCAAAAKSAAEIWNSHEAKEMFNGMLHRISKTLERSSDTDINYYRVLAMKASIYYEEAKQLTALYDYEIASGLLSKALELIQPFPLKVEIVFLILRIMNHYSYLLITRADKLEMAQTLLQDAETIYNNMCSSGQDTTVFYTTEDLFRSEVETLNLIEKNSGKLEKLATNNMQMLGYVYHKQGLMDKFVIYHHFVLNRHLESQDDDPLTWANKADRLASYFLKVRKFRDARHHLTAAWTVVNRLERITKSRKPTDNALATLKKIEFMYNKLATTWVYYGTCLFGWSRAKLLQELSQGVEETIWKSPFESHNGPHQQIPPDSILNNIHEQEEMGPDFDTVSDISIPQAIVSSISVNDNISQITLGAFKPPQKGNKDSFDSDIIVKPEGWSNASSHGADMSFTGNIQHKPAINPEDAFTDTLDNLTSTAKDESKIPTFAEATDGTQINPDHSRSKSPIVTENVTSSAEDKSQSTPNPEAESNSGEIPLIFHSLRIAGLERKVPAEFIETTQAARALFNHTYDMLKIAKRYHNVRDHPSNYEHWVLTLCDLYDFLAFYEQDLHDQYELQSHRAQSLESLTYALRRVRPDYYVTVNLDLLRELSNIQMELLEMNFRKMFSAQIPAMSDIAHSLHQMEEFSKIRNRF